MLLQHKFLSDGCDRDILLENTAELVRSVESDERFRLIKPYIYSAILSRKHKMMKVRKNYSPNLSEAFKYTGYKIGEDNGKNFDTYQSYLELYEQLRRHYSDDCDIGFSDYCFAELSNLSEWYYENCEPNEDIPMTLEYAFTYYAGISTSHTGGDVCVYVWKIYPQRQRTAQEFLHRRPDERLFFG